MLVTDDGANVLLVYRVRMVSLATQKFVADVANDALQYSKQRTASTSKKSKVGRALESLFHINRPIACST